MADIGYALAFILSLVVFTIAVYVAALALLDLHQWRATPNDVRGFVRNDRRAAAVALVIGTGGAITSLTVAILLWSAWPT